MTGERTKLTCTIVGSCLDPSLNSSYVSFAFLSRSMVRKILSTRWGGRQLSHNVCILWANAKSRGGALTFSGVSSSSGNLTICPVILYIDRTICSISSYVISPSLLISYSWNAPDPESVVAVPQAIEMREATHISASRLAVLLMSPRAHR